MMQPVYERVKRRDPLFAANRRHCDNLNALQYRWGSYSYAEALAARAFQYRAAKKRKRVVSDD